MFGTNDNNQAAMGSPTVQNPSMLDNVSQQDFQVADDTKATDDNQTTSDTNQHAITTDNPFVQDVVASTVSVASTSSTPTASQAQPAASVPTPNESVSSSAPVQPPIVEEETSEEDNSSYVDALAEDVMPTATATTTNSTVEPVDHAKLAAIKQEALEHLEPLAEHIDGTPEETFKTTMMMIQANDNHTLLEKALEAAKKIEDDKTRAQAMLDIINEINYFSQISQ